MALYQFLSGVAVVILLSANGCYSDEAACGKIMPGHSRNILPWDVKIIHNNGSCRGVLISHNWVVTYGGCDFGIDCTKVELGQEHKGVYIETRNVSDAMCTKHVGICLYKLSYPVNFTMAISPACLPASGSKYNNAMGAVVQIGFNQTREEWIVGRKRCECKLPELKMKRICSSYNRMDANDHDDELAGGHVAGGHAGGGSGKDDCQDTRGGALMVKYKMHTVLTGLREEDGACGMHNSLQPYSDISEYEDWIAEVAEDVPESSFIHVKPMENDTDEDFECNPEPPMTTPPPHDCKDHPTTPPHDCGHHPTTPPHDCGHHPTTPPHDCGHHPPPGHHNPCGDDRDDDSIFASGSTMVQSSFTFLCLLGLSFYFTG